MQLSSIHLVTLCRRVVSNPLATSEVALLHYSCLSGVQAHDASSGAARHHNRAVFEESMNLCTSVLWCLSIIQKLTPKICGPWWPVYWFPIWRQNDHSFAHISCSVAPRTNIQVSIPMFSMYRNILAMSESTSGGRHIGFQDGRHMFLHYFVSHFLLHFGRKIKTLHT